MKYLLVLSILVISCRHRAKDISYEHGVVVGKGFTPAWSSTDIGMGMSSSGHLVTTVSSSGQPDKYSVVFHCEHGVTFPIQSQDLYTRLHEGDTVVISYYDITDGEGKVKDFQFVNAVKERQ